jgi:hypothetical protein
VLVEVGAVPVAPLETVNRSEVAVIIRPFVPDPDAVFFQVTNIGFAFQEPQQFVYDRFDVQFFGRYQWEPLAEVETHLVTENADSARAGTIAFLAAVFKYVADKVMVLLHFTTFGF